MAEQLGLNLPVRTALGREDFIVAPSNSVAVAMLDAFAAGPPGKLVLSGPEGAGKTHLCHVWAHETGAPVVAASDLSEDRVEALAEGPCAIEDVPQIAKDTQAQKALFHLHNLALAQGQRLLLTGRAVPNLWAIPLPDLQSRIDAAGHVAIDAPDDALLGAVLGKLFDDRQLCPKGDVIPYLVTRMERSFAAAGRIIEALDAQSLAEKREITRKFAGQVLDSFT